MVPSIPFPPETLNLLVVSPNFLSPLPLAATNLLGVCGFGQSGHGTSMESHNAWPCVPASLMSPGPPVLHHVTRLDLLPFPSVPVGATGLGVHRKALSCVFILTLPPVLGVTGLQRQWCRLWSEELQGTKE